MVKDKRAAMELSIGTVVIIVLAMIMLGLGLILIRSIFSGAEGAVTSINTGVRDEINKLFTDDDKKMGIYPAARKIEIKQKSENEGFAFSVRNVRQEETEFEWKVEVDGSFDVAGECKMSVSEANDLLIVDSGSFKLAPGDKLGDPKLVLFKIPEGTPPCTLPYNVEATDKDTNQFYDSRTVYLTIRPK